jgi:hypothetical protein
VGHPLEHNIEACRAKSPADFISKIVSAERLADLQKENDELTAIFVASVKTAKKNRITKIHHS